MDYIFDICLKNRAILSAYLEDLSLEELNKVPKGFNNNVFWNIAHVVVTQELLVYTLSNLEGNINKQLIEKYRKGTKTEENVTQIEVDEIKRLLFSTIEKTKEDYNNHVFKTYNEYTVSTKGVLRNVEDALHFNNFHEGIHLGYILALKKSI
ncbi:DinB family protein [Flavobacteriaceae bacterium AU392]|nr:DinB family protein [Flavobacteriaceae bacterium]RKM84691.1 DinB family protein [Flavobacteriaceae bacterium AU392]